VQLILGLTENRIQFKRQNVYVFKLPHKWMGSISVVYVFSNTWSSISLFVC